MALFIELWPGLLYTRKFYHFGESMVTINLATLPFNNLSQKGSFVWYLKAKPGRKTRSKILLIKQGYPHQS
jgi:hypothetical protein